jgi:hypothetical protein
MIRKQMTNVTVTRLGNNYVSYTMPGTEVLNYVHHGYKGKLRNLGLIEGQTYTVTQEAVSQRPDGRWIYEWTEAYNKKQPKPQPVAPQRTTLLEF